MRNDFIHKQGDFVEKVTQIFYDGDLFALRGFKHFYKMVVFKRGQFEDYIMLTYFLPSDLGEIVFTEIQRLLRFWYREQMKMMIY